jgi:hypothetical protein
MHGTTPDGKSVVVPCSDEHSMTIPGRCHHPRRLQRRSRSVRGRRSGVGGGWTWVSVGSGGGAPVKVGSGCGRVGGQASADRAKSPHAVLAKGERWSRQSVWRSLHGAPVKGARGGVKRGWGQPGGTCHRSGEAAGSTGVALCHRSEIRVERVGQALQVCVHGAGCGSRHT